MNFQKPLIGLDGEVVKDAEGNQIILGKILAGYLVGANKGDALKMFSWAQKLYNGKPVDFDKSDKETLKEFVKSNEQLSILTKAQLLEIIVEEPESKKA
jgi:hypothetical protein